MWLEQEHVLIIRLVHCIVQCTNSENLGHLAVYDFKADAGNVDCAGELQVSLSQQPLLCSYVSTYAATPTKESFIQIDSQRTLTSGSSLFPNNINMYLVCPWYWGWNWNACHYLWFYSE